MGVILVALKRAAGVIFIGPEEDATAGEAFHQGKSDFDQRVRQCEGLSRKNTSFQNFTIQLPSVLIFLPKLIFQARVIALTARAPLFFFGVKSEFRCVNSREKHRGGGARGNLAVWAFRRTGLHFFFLQVCPSFYFSLWAENKPCFPAVHLKHLLD